MTDDTDETGRRLRAALHARAAAEAFETPSLDELADRAVTVDLSHPTDRAPTRRRRTVAVLSGVGVTGVAAAAVAVLVATSGSGAPQHQQQVAGGSPRPHDGATHTPIGPPTYLGTAAGKRRLAELAAARERSGDPMLQPGQYLLQDVRSREPVFVYGRSKTPQRRVLETSFDRTWRPADESDVWVRVMSSDSGDEPAMRGACNDIYRHTEDPPPGPPGCARTGSFDDLTPAFVAKLPRDPSRLYARLRQEAKSEDAGASPDAQIVSVVYGMEQSDIVPADLGAGLLRALAEDHGVRVVDNVRTLTGRVGVGVQDAAADTGMIFNRSTGQFMGFYSGRPGTKAFDPEDATYSVVNSAPTGR